MITYGEQLDQENIRRAKEMCALEEGDAIAEEERRG